MTQASRDAVRLFADKVLKALPSFGPPPDEALALEPGERLLGVYLGGSAPALTISTDGIRMGVPPGPLIRYFEMQDVVLPRVPKSECGVIQLELEDRVMEIEIVGRRGSALDAVDLHRFLRKASRRVRKGAEEQA